MKTKLFTLLLCALLLSACSTHVKTRQDVLLESQRIKQASALSIKPDKVLTSFPLKKIFKSQPAFVKKFPQENNQDFRTLPEYEELVYKARYLGMTIGTMKASIKGITKINGRDAYQFELTARTEGVFRKMFKVDDRYVSYMDVENRHVLRHEEYRREGKYKKDVVVNFDQQNHKAHYKHLLNGTEKTIDIPENVQDVVTANYFFRMMPWELGDTVSFKVYAEEEVYDLFGIVKSKVSLALPFLGKKQAYVFEPYALLDGEKVKKGSVVGFFAASDLRAPLRGDIKTPIFGKAYVVLSQEKYLQQVALQR